MDFYFSFFFFFAHFESSWEDVVLEVTVFSVKSTDVTYKIHSG